jgi:hypothetical protein
MATARKKAQPDQSKIVAQTLAESKPSADSAGFLRDIISEWGGTANLARCMKREYDEAGPGGQTRQRILEMIQRLVIMNTQHDLSKSVDPSRMDDADLQRIAERLVKKVSDATIAAAGPE